jgi:hypothetical protein
MLAAGFWLDSWSTLHPTIGLAYRLKEDFCGIYEATTRSDAEARYAAREAAISPAVSDAFKPLTTAWMNWNGEILAYFDHRVTNAYTESLNALRQQDRAGRGYSFEALRAKMLYTEGLHKVERPKFERRAASGFSAFMFRVPDDDATGMMTPDEVYGEPTNQLRNRHFNNWAAASKRVRFAYMTTHVVLPEPAGAANGRSGALACASSQASTRA